MYFIMTSGPKRRLSSGYRVQKWSLPRCMLIPRTCGFTDFLSMQNEGNHRSYNERRPLSLGQYYPLWRTSSGPSRTSGAIKNSSQVRHKQTLTFDVMLYLFIHLLFVKYFRFMSSLYPTWSSNSQPWDQDPPTRLARHPTVMFHNSLLPWLYLHRTGTLSPGREALVTSES